MKYLFLFSISILFISNVSAQTNEKEILNKFFEIYKEDPVKALDFIYGTSKWVDKEGDSVKKLKSQLNQFRELVGDYYEEEYITKAKFGNSFVTYIYLVKYERQPIRFTFEFYKPQNNWVLYSFSFDDNFDDDLENIMKYEYLNSGY